MSSLTGVDEIFKRFFLTSQLTASKNRVNVHLSGFLRLSPHQPLPSNDRAWCKSVSHFQTMYTGRETMKTCTSEIIIANANSCSAACQWCIFAFKLEGAMPIFAVKGFRHAVAAYKLPPALSLHACLSCMHVSVHCTLSNCLSSFCCYFFRHCKLFREWY